MAAALAADNVVVAVYFAFLFSICRPSSDEELSLSAMKPTQAAGERSWILILDSRPWT